MQSMWGRFFASFPPVRGPHILPALSLVLVVVCVDVCLKNGHPEAMWGGLKFPSPGRGPGGHDII